MSFFLTQNSNSSCLASQNLHFAFPFQRACVVRGAHFPIIPKHSLHPVNIILFTSVLPKRLYKTHTPCIYYHLRNKTQVSSWPRQTPSLLTLLPFPLFFHWRSPLPFCLLFLFPSSSISWAMLAVEKILFCTLDFSGAPCAREARAWT